VSDGADERRVALSSVGRVRRRALLGCGALAALAAIRASRGGGLPGVASAETEVQRWPRAELRWEGRGSLRAAEIVPHADYVFAYPFDGTPCFLLDLGRPLPGADLALRAGGGYTWPGGVGQRRSVVAYSAICPHTYTHPTRDAAMIHYFPPDQPATVAQRGGVITCCVHGSAFDPGQGAVPLQPPAEVPLATVLLEWDVRTDGLHAVGIAGRPVFVEFFKSFPKSARREVEGGTVVQELAGYTRSILPC
jgi:Rieske Fe-S protein